MLLYFCIIVGRLFHLQVINHDRLKNSSEKNFLRFKTMPALRGNILDCNGVALATNQPVTQLMWKGSGNIRLTIEQERALDKILKILSCDEITLKPKIKHAEKFSLELLITESITSDQLCLIAEQCSDIPNVIFVTKFERFYPYNKLASHILGYLGDVQVCAHGKMGLEKICEDTLRGDPGVMMQSMNSFGTLLNSEQIKQGSSGEDIVTSIDLQLQQMVETALENEISGSCILMDPQTGHIKALVSKPNFEPTVFTKKITPQEWQDLQQQKVFLNRAFNSSYPPASIFKLITIAAALEEKIISTESHFVCHGCTEFKGRTYYCNKRTGHGRISTEECLAFSCNIPLYEIGKKLHIDTLARYAYEFGLGNKTNVPFSEQFGLVPTNKWKLKNKGERWWTGETMSAAIGQSFLLATPIQLACMIGSIFHGYLVTPRIVQHGDPEKRPIKISLQTRLFLQNCMKIAVSGGTARRVSKIGHLTVFSKTGTAQTRTRRNDEDPDDEKKSREEKAHAWLACYFYTDKTEPLVMITMVEHVGKSTYVMNVARKFFIAYSRWSMHKN